MPLFKKLAIVGGAGGVGSTAAFYLGLKEIAAQIALIDVAGNLLETHLIDLRECFGEECDTAVAAGGLGLLSGSDAVVMAASKAGGPVASRDEYLGKNLELVEETAKAVKSLCPKALVVVATAPTDALTVVFHDILGGDRKRILGFCRNDSQRFRWALSQALKVDQRRLGGLVIGEHGPNQIPVFSSVTVDKKRALITSSQKDQVLQILGDWYGHWQAQKSGRTTTWTSATSLYKTLLALAGRLDETPMGSVVLAGEYGHEGVALGLPLTPAPRGQLGWGEVAALDLTVEETKALNRSAQTVQALVEEARARYGSKGR